MKALDITQHRNTLLTDFRATKVAYGDVVIQKTKEGSATVFALAKVVNFNTGSVTTERLNDSGHVFKQAMKYEAMFLVQDNEHLRTVTLEELRAFTEIKHRARAHTDFMGNPLKVGDFAVFYHPKNTNYAPYSTLAMGKIMSMTDKRVTLERMSPSTGKFDFYPKHEFNPNEHVTVGKIVTAYIPGAEEYEGVPFEWAKKLMF